MQAIGDQPIRNNSSSAARVTARVLECLAKAPSWDCNFTFKHYMVSLGWESSVWGACMQSSQYHLPHVVSSLMPHIISSLMFHIMSSLMCVAASSYHVGFDGQCTSCLGSSTMVSLLRNDAPAASAAQRYCRCFGTTAESTVQQWWASSSTVQQWWYHCSAQALGTSVLVYLQ